MFKILLRARLFLKHVCKRELPQSLLWLASFLAHIHGLFHAPVRINRLFIVLRYFEGFYEFTYYSDFKVLSSVSDESPLYPSNLFKIIANSDGNWLFLASRRRKSETGAIWTLTFPTPLKSTPNLNKFEKSPHKICMRTQFGSSPLFLALVLRTLTWIPEVFLKQSNKDY